MIRLSLTAALLAAAIVSPSRAHESTLPWAPYILFPPRVQVVRVPPGSVIHRERRGLVWPRWRYVVFAPGNRTPAKPETAQATSNPPPAAPPAQ